MRFRPANISLINRRHYLPRLLLTLSSFEKNDQRILTRSLHITSVLPTTRAHRRFRSAEVCLVRTCDNRTHDE